MTTYANELFDDGVEGPQEGTSETIPEGCLIAGIPHLLGFTPEDSLIVLALSDRAGSPVIATMRVDLPDPMDSVDRDALIDWIAEPLEQAAGLSTALAVILWSGPPIPANEQFLTRVSRVLTDSTGLDTRSILVWHGPRTREALKWRPAVGPDSGIGDRAATDLQEHPITDRDHRLAKAMFAVAGRNPAASRDDLEAEIRPQQVDDEREASLTQVDRDAFEVAVGHSIAVLRGEFPPDRSHLRLLTSAVADIRVRDTVIHDLMSDPRRRWAVAADVLAEAVRTAPKRVRAPLATCLAIMRWQLGDGARAIIAVTSALESDPGYSLARLIGGSIAGGVHPESWRRDLIHLPREVCSGRRG